MIITLQGSLEIEGVAYSPGEQVDVPEWLYDQLTEQYLSFNKPVEEVKNYTFFEELG